MRIIVMKAPRVLAASAVLLAATACGSAGANGTDAGSADGLRVTAAFYPVQWAAQRVGGAHVSVRGLTKPGVEPHDLELTPRAVGELAASDVVVYLAGFQPAVDEAVRTQAPDAGFDVSRDAGLTLAATEVDAHDDHDDDDDHADQAAARDPHFWLDPVRLERVSTAIAERFATVDPARAGDYRANAASVARDLRVLDTDFRSGLARCRSDELVTGHAAFGYLAARYGLSQEGIAGVNPDTEPDAATLRELAAHVEQHGVTTVYSEALVDPALAETLARETGARVAVLDPLEGLTDGSRGRDYLEVMRSNLAVLEQGQGCS
jgi:zinc transport system substrate-binding protein